MLWPSCFSRTTTVRTDGGEAGERETGDVRVPGVERLLRRLERLVGHRREKSLGDGAGDAGRDDARAGDRRVEGHGRELAGVRRARAGDDEDRLRAVLARGHRLVAQVRVAGENALGLLVGVLGEIAQHEDDLVLHVERRVAVVAEILAVGHDDAVAGEDDRTLDLAVVGERQRAHVGMARCRRLPERRCPRRSRRRRRPSAT